MIILRKQGECRNARCSRDLIAPVQYSKESTHILQHYNLINQQLTGNQLIVARQIAIHYKQCAGSWSLTDPFFTVSTEMVSTKKKSQTKMIQSIHYLS